MCLFVLEPHTLPVACPFTKTSSCLWKGGFRLPPSVIYPQDGNQPLNEQYCRIRSQNHFANPLRGSVLQVVTSSGSMPRFCSGAPAPLRTSGSLFAEGACNRVGTLARSAQAGWKVCRGAKAIPSQNHFGLSVCFPYSMLVGRGLCLMRSGREVVIPHSPGREKCLRADVHVPRRWSRQAPPCKKCGRFSLFGEAFPANPMAYSPDSRKKPDPVLWESAEERTPFLSVWWFVPLNCLGEPSTTCLKRKSTAP